MATSIKEATTGITKAWGKQKNKGCTYRKLRYLLESPCEDGTLVYNLVTGELILLTGTEEETWKDLPGIPNQDMTSLPEEAGLDTQGCLVAPESPLSPLLEKHFLVPTGYDEYKAVSSLRSLLRKLNTGRAITHFLILPTSGCNARCFYCYESNYPHHTMTRETAADVVRFIKSQSKGEKVHLNWFGGEPMVAWPRIRQICESLTKEGIEFDSTMISNGYLFNGELAREAKLSWKMKKIQITLDGTEETYNKTKAYVGVTGSPFRVVLDNIDSLLTAGIKVAVRLNLGSHNADDLSSLIEELSVRFSERENLYIDLAILYEGEGFTPTHHSEEEFSLLSERQNRLYERLTEKHFQTYTYTGYLRSLDAEICMADSPASVLINPLGQLGKCEHYAFERLCGTVTEGITDASVWKSWTVPLLRKPCEKCKLYPYCATQEYCRTSKACSKAKEKVYLSRILSNMQTVYKKFLSHDV